METRGLGIPDKPYDWQTLQRIPYWTLGAFVTPTGTDEYAYHLLRLVHHSSPCEHAGVLARGGHPLDTPTYCKPLALLWALGALRARACYTS